MEKNKSKILKFTLIAFAMILSTLFVVAQPIVDLGTAEDFVILSDAGISTTGTTSIVGDIGVGPAVTATAITGFGLIMDSSNQFSTSDPVSLVSGKVYAYNYAVPTPAKMNTAILNMQTAYNDVAGRTHTNIVTELGAGDISGMTITPGISDGLYKWGTGVLINRGSGTGDPNGVTLDCQGNANAIFIFQIDQTLNLGDGAKITLIDCQAKNIFWQVVGQTTLGTTSVFNGNILDGTAIVIKTGAKLNGRALAQTGITLEANIISLPIIKDTISPVITINNIIPINVTLNSVYIDAGATATDNIDSVVSVNSVSTVNTSIIGTYTVTYTAVDSAGNAAIPVVRTVNVIPIVKDIIPPVVKIISPQNNLIINNGNATVKYTAFEETSNLTCVVMIFKEGETIQVSDYMNPLNNVVTSVDFTNVENGNYSWNVYCIDISWNLGMNDINYTTIFDSNATTPAIVSPSSSGGSSGGGGGGSHHNYVNVIPTPIVTTKHIILPPIEATTVPVNTPIETAIPSSSITGNVIANTLKSSIGKALLVGIGIIALISLGYFTLFRKKK